VKQSALFDDPKPPNPIGRGIDLRLCSCTDERFLRDARGAALVIADPPWSYVQRIGASRASNHYDCLSIGTILMHLAALEARRMALWVTEPLVDDWIAATVRARDEERWRWGRSVAGGAWIKSGDPAAWKTADASDEGHYGPGYHWAGCEEPVRLYEPGVVEPVRLYTRAGSHTDRSEPLRNGWIEPPDEHSRKPPEWQRQWIKRWTEPGDLIVDPYAGLGSVAEAVMLAGEGRRYLGAEINPKRHAQALGLLAQVRIAA
jgi:hypothetical protein